MQCFFKGEWDSSAHYGHNFSVKPKLVEYSEFLLPFELLLWVVKQENICDEDLSLMKARVLDTDLLSYESFSSDQSPSENLTSEFKAFRQLCKNKNIVIQKVGKGNTMVTLDKISNISVI